MPSSMNIGRAFVQRLQNAGPGAVNGKITLNPKPKAAKMLGKLMSRELVHLLLGMSYSYCWLLLEVTLKITAAPMFWRAPGRFSRMSFKIASHPVPTCRHSDEGSYIAYAI